MANIEGVVLCILFGSRAREDSDAYSDYDLLVVFEDKDKMWRNFKKLYENTSSTSLFI
ncbi:MAG: nucleotidyltransferase domain-containing protein [Thermoproteota archaeon]